MQLINNPGNSPFGRPFHEAAKTDSFSNTSIDPLRGAAKRRLCRRLTFIRCGFLFAGDSGRVGYRGIRSGELFRLYAEWRTCHRFRCGKRCARLSNGPSRAEYCIPPFGGDLRRGRPRRARRNSRTSWRRSPSARRLPPP